MSRAGGENAIKGMREFFEVEQESGDAMAIGAGLRRV
jgi:hypothetical protein